MNFNKQQLEAINHINGNLAVIATAGSGKTAVLTHRVKNMIGNCGISPASILPITFSRKARDTMEERLKQLGVHNVEVETFHSFAYKIICDVYGYGRFKLWTATWEKEKVLLQICRGFGISVKKGFPYNEIMAFISLQKTNMKSPKDKLVYKKGLPYTRKIMANIYVEYEDYKNKNLYIEFDDFFAMALEAFVDDSELLKKYRDKYKYVLVDEFQDVSLPQAKLLKKINTKNTMIVGDPLQAIYSFRGGNSKFILNFDKDYKNVKIVNLNTNYRCSKDIVNTSNALANSIPDSSHRNYVESVANNEDYKTPQVNHFDTDRDEAIWVAEKISDLQASGYKSRDIAVLARTNAQLLRMETALCDLNCSFSVGDSTAFFNFPEITLVLSYLKLALNQSDNEAFSQIYNKPHRWLDKKFFEEVKSTSIKNNMAYYDAMLNIPRREWKFSNGINEIVAVISRIRKMKYSSVAKVVSYLRKKLDIDAFVSRGKQNDDGNYTEQVENLDIFEDFCADYTKIEDVLSYVSEFQNADSDNNQDKINLLTVHKSKGTEYSVVFIIGCNDTILPHRRAENTDDERRLFYVGITRAEKELYLSYADENKRGFMEISPFIKELGGTVQNLH